jgi:hypothetical protein
MANIQRIRSRLMAQCSTNAYCLCSEDHFVYKYVYETGVISRLFQLPRPADGLAGRFKEALLRNGVVRFFRRNLGIFNIVELPTGTILALYDNVYRYPCSNGSGRAEPTISLQKLGFIGPLKNGVAVNPENNCAYCGEYQNSRPYAVKILRISDDGRQADIGYTFPEGKIKHIHSLTWDPYRKRLWIATGDNNSEVGLYYTDDDFHTVSFFQGGSQTWRMVSLLPTENFLYWGSDAGKDATEHDINSIFRWNFLKNCLEKICDIGNPAYYSAFLDNGGMIIGTTYEPGMKQRTEHSAAIWYSEQGEQWRKIYSLPYKDMHAPQRTQYATINLPKGIIPCDAIPFTPLNTQKWDFDLVMIRR